MRDPRLAAQARNTLHLAPGEPLTVAHLETLTDFHAARLAIADLRGLERASRLTALNLSGNPITTLEPLRHLASLVQLELNEIPGLDGKELAHIRGLPNLRSLQFEGRRNVDDALEIVSSISTLEMLSVLGGATGTANGVRRLDNLVSLNGLSLMHFANPIDDGLDGIGRLHGLKCLNLTGSNVTDAGVAKLAGLERLSYFALGDTRITDASTGEIDVAWNSNVNGSVYTIAVDAATGKVYVGGAFTSVNGGAHTRAYVAAFDEADSVNTGAPEGGYSYYASVGGNVVGQDPRLGSLGFNGGSTRTHALRAASPALDVIPPSSLPLDITTDQRGQPRTWPAGGMVDIGAYEQQYPPTAANNWTRYE